MNLAGNSQIVLIRKQSEFRDFFIFRKKNLTYLRSFASCSRKADRISNAKMKKKLVHSRRGIGSEHRELWNVNLPGWRRRRSNKKRERERKFFFSYRSFWSSLNCYYYKDCLCLKRTESFWSRTWFRCLPNVNGERVQTHLRSVLSKDFLMWFRLFIRGTFVLSSFSTLSGRGVKLGYPFPNGPTHLEPKVPTQNIIHQEGESLCDSKALIQLHLFLLNKGLNFEVQLEHKTPKPEDSPARKEIKKKTKRTVSCMNFFLFGLDVKM